MKVLYNTSKIEDCKIIRLTKIPTGAGYITSINNKLDIPFDVQRIYYMYDIPSGETRGGHAHKQLFQLVVAAMGSFDFSICDGYNSIKISLNRPDQGLLIVPGIWREISNFSAGSILLVLASETYDENDYIRSYDDFLKIKH